MQPFKCRKSKMYEFQILILSLNVQMEQLEKSLREKQRTW